MLYDILASSDTIFYADGNILGGDFMGKPLACPQCGYNGTPAVRIYLGEFLIKCACCSFTVHTNVPVPTLINIWNEEVSKYADK